MTSDPRALLEAHAQSVPDLGPASGPTVEGVDPEAIRALRAVLDECDRWRQKPCVCGYRIPNGNDDSSQCEHCAADEISDAITTALEGTK